MFSRNKKNLTGTLIIFIFLLSAGMDCNKNNNPPEPPSEDPCGTFRTGSLELFAGDFKDIALDELYNSDGNNAHYNFTTDTIVDVCPLKHIELAFYIITRERWTDLTYTAVIKYGEFSTVQITKELWNDCSDGTSYCDKTEIAIDLESSFGTTAGWFTPSLDIRFETEGDMTLDHEKLELYVASFLIEWKYYEYKSP